MQTLRRLMAVLAVLFPGLAAGDGQRMPNTGFTQGEGIPPRSRKNWNPPATGARGWGIAISW